MVGPQRRARSQAILVGSLALATLATLSVSGLVAPAQDADGSFPLPFDPPTQAEQALAAEIALADPAVQEMLDERHAFLGAALHTQKLPETPASEHPRLFDTWFYDYPSNTVVWAVIEPAQARVVEIVPVDFPFQPPLAGVELQRAVDLAFGLQATVERFPEGPPSATAILVSGAGTSCPTDRCALVGFIEGGGPAMDFLVLVNLSEDRVVDITDGDSRQEVVRA